MNLDDIGKIAKILSIDTLGKTPSELIREIQRREGNFDCFGSSSGYCDQTRCCFRSLCLEESKKLPARNASDRLSTHLPVYYSTLYLAGRYGGRKANGAS